MNFILLHLACTFVFCNLIDSNQNNTMFSFFQNDKPPYSVEKIAEGKLLDKAKEVDINFFFKHWMQNKPRKAMVGAWFVLYENEEFIYWGYPVFKRVFSDKRIVDDFYKTAKKDLQQQFPNYRKIEGNDVRLRLHQAIHALQPAPDYDVTVSFGFKAKLLEDAILIETPCTIKPRSGPDAEKTLSASYKVRLDKNNLDLIDIQKLN